MLLTARCSLNSVGATELTEVAEAVPAAAGPATENYLKQSTAKARDCLRPGQIHFRG